MKRKGKGTGKERRERRERLDREERERESNERGRVWSGDDEKEAYRKRGAKEEEESRLTSSQIQAGFDTKIMECFTKLHEEIHLLVSILTFDTT